MSHSMCWVLPRGFSTQGELWLLQKEGGKDNEYKSLGIQASLVLLLMEQNFSHVLTKRHEKQNPKALAEK